MKILLSIVLFIGILEIIKTLKYNVFALDSLNLQNFFFSFVNYFIIIPYFDTLMLKILRNLNNQWPL